MSWRTVVVSSHCKLEYKLGYLVCRGETTKKIHLSEIGSLIIETPAVSFTAVLICELIKNKINVVFCDEKHNPHSQVLAIHGSHDTSKKLKNQIEWEPDIKTIVWTEIVKNKLIQQASFLSYLNLSQAEKLFSYIKELQLGDSTNREGHAAKVYFNALFGENFFRGDTDFINSALNYGYSLILSLFNRIIVANGYNTQIGLFHKNEFNPFNFSSDLMEPFRPLVDRMVYNIKSKSFDTEEKRYMQNIFNEKVFIFGKMYCLTDAAAIYCKSIFDALCNRDVSLIKNYELQIYENSCFF